jgi:hypothetical protein
VVRGHCSLVSHSKASVFADHFRADKEPLIGNGGC